MFPGRGSNWAAIEWKPRCLVQSEIVGCNVVWFLKCSTNIWEETINCAFRVILFVIKKEAIDCCETINLHGVNSHKTLLWISQICHVCWLFFFAFLHYMVGDYSDVLEEPNVFVFFSKVVGKEGMCRLYGNVGGKLARIMGSVSVVTTYLIWGGSGEEKQKILALWSIPVIAC